MNFRDNQDFLNVRRLFDEGKYKCSVYSDNEDYVRQIIKELDRDGHPSTYIENGFCKGQYIIRRRGEKMNSVQRFISENQHQLGYIMHEASKKWIENDKVGALTVGECNAVVEKHGEYHEVLSKMEKYRETLKAIRDLSVVDSELIDAQYIALLTLGEV